MSAVFLLLLITAAAGLSASRLAMRMAPLSSEFPAKTVIATLLAGLAAAAEFGLLRAPPWIVVAAAVLAPIYVFAAPLLVYLVRAGGARAAGALARLLYWSPEGRAAVLRLLAQAALQVGDPRGALALSPVKDALLLSQALLLEGDWEGVLKVDAPPPAGRAADNAHLIAAARVEALVMLGRVEEAERELGALKTRVEANRKGPLGHRAVVLSEARLAAFRGEFEAVRDLLAQPLVGVRPPTLYRLLGFAAERAGRFDVAARAYEAAYGAAAKREQELIGADLRRIGREPPEARAAARARPLATYALAGVLAVAYLGQALLDRLVGPVSAAGAHFLPSHLVAGFLEGLPALPSADAWWRYLSYAFLHANLVHLGFNLWVLLDLGRLYERRRHWGDLLAAFAAGSAGGALLTTIFQAGELLVLVGASGGILGVAGALLSEVLLSRSAADRLLLRSLVQWMLLILLFSLAVKGVSLWGHVGGAAGGFVYGALKVRLRLGERFAQAAGLLSVSLLALAVVTALVTMLPLLP